MSIVSNFSPLLFLTFRSLYDISFTMLGLLVLVNFVTQLTVDLAFSFFSHKFNIPLAVKMTPVLTVLGLIVYSIAPFIFPDNVYLGLIIGTVIFSASGGFCEVLISPVIAAMPAKNPEGEMSKLHSIYAWGVVGTVIVTTLYLILAGVERWWILSLAFAAIPAISIILFTTSTLPKLEKPERASGILEYLKQRSLWVCVLAIFLGGAAECTMAQWCSGYIEEALGLPKVWGDIFGVALFSVMLGLGRSTYAKYGKNITRVLTFGAIGSTICYATAILSGSAVIGLFACALTGLCVSMMWPGSLIIGAERFPTAGVFIYAMMAAGGDLGASVGPQLVGIIADEVSATQLANRICEATSLSCDQIGMKAGMLVGVLVSLAAVYVYARMWRTYAKRK
jgi:MFS family permease